MPPIEDRPNIDLGFVKIVFEVPSGRRWREEYERNIEAAGAKRLIGYVQTRLGVEGLLPGKEVTEDFVSPKDDSKRVTMTLSLDDSGVLGSGKRIHAEIANELGEYVSGSIDVDGENPSLGSERSRGFASHPSSEDLKGSVATVGTFIQWTNDYTKIPSST